MIYGKELRFSTRGEIDLVDITAEVERTVEESGIEKGVALVFVPGATGAIVTIEHEPGLLEDFRRALREQKAPATSTTESMITPTAICARPFSARASASPLSTAG